MVFTDLITNIKSIAGSVPLGRVVDLDPDSIEQELTGSRGSKSRKILPYKGSVTHEHFHVINFLGNIN
jgi:hypothetical protein